MGKKTIPGTGESIRPQATAQPPKQFRTLVVFDEVTSKEITEFCDREGLRNQEAVRLLVQYALREHPKHFPRGLWISHSYDVRNFVLAETSKFLYDLAKQLGQAADLVNANKTEEGEAA